MAEQMDLAEQFMSCTRKKRFATAELAHQAIVKIWLSGRGDGLKIYRCRVVDQEAHWHVGHLVTWWRRNVIEGSADEG